MLNKYETTAQAVDHSYEIWKQWRELPAPQRGEIVRRFGDILRRHKPVIVQRLTETIHKTTRESQGEVQEAIDMCDFAVGLSRQLYGLTMPSERPQHRIQEVWQPLGPVVVITAFNFPIAVWAWNFCLAVICGNTVIWKPSELDRSLHEIMHLAWGRACKEFGRPEFADVSIIHTGGKDIAQQLAANPKVALVSATGSVQMGQEIGQIVAKRLGRCLLELGGNNAVVVSEHADLDLAIKGTVFGAVGTTGQRCTTTRRAFVHERKFYEFLDRIRAAYKTIKIGDPKEERVLIGPLINEEAYQRMERVLLDNCGWGHDLGNPSPETLLDLFDGLKGMYLLCGGDRILISGDDRVYVSPSIIVSKFQSEIMKQETFAPILYVMPYKTLDEAIDLVNDTPYGLSAAIFTNNVLEAEKFMRDVYCGIVNVNTSTSGAEIGGAFGGEKNTGGGRESGSDSWKNYMRRCTSTINYSGELPLAQGIEFK